MTLESAYVLEVLKQYIMQYGYIALYTLLAAGIVGLPVPDEILMTFVGYLSSIGWFRFWISFAVSFAGAMTGMMVSYMLGKRVGKPFLWRHGKWIKLTPARLDRAEQWFQKYGLWTVCFGYFVPGVRHFTCYLAGVSGVTLWRYLLFAGTGALVWSATFISLGYFIGDSFESVIYLLHKYVGFGFLILVPIIGIVILFIMRRRKQARH